MADVVDDSEEKSRRNLVTLSSAILATTYLQPKLADKGKLFGFIDAVDVNPIRVWTLITIALCYFAFRYWYSSGRAKTWSEWITHRDIFVKSMFKKRIEQHGLRYWKTDTPSHFMNFESISPPTDQRALALRASLDSEDFSINPKSIYLHLSIIGPINKTLDHLTCTFKLTDWRSKIFHNFTVARSALLCNATHELFIPFTLFGIALVVCIVELIRL
ncbi:hypothetical protein [Ralstonia solanacearum]|uniref:hypothetical protein n=1 Tax=Ralstonia solanacearum TaxID=305 RepID=UPI0018D0FAB9|nr:hypothetical protein [Ralstonia solanacearum]